MKFGSLTDLMKYREGKFVLDMYKAVNGIC